MADISRSMLRISYSEHSGLTQIVEDSDEDDTIRARAPSRRELRQYGHPSGILHLDLADRKVIRIADVRDSIQKKTFTKWANKHLSKRHEEITELFEDFKDGTKLLTLLEILSSQILPREKGQLRFHRLQNIKGALDFLICQRIKLVNVHPEDIADGNPKITLGLVWMIILKFQVTDLVLPGQHEQSVRQSLLQWSQQTVSGYPIKITDFSKCWKDGKAFLYLIHRNRPELVNMRQVASNTAQENLELAFSIAENHLGVTRLLDPEDMQVEQPDEKSVITYVASLYNVFPLPSPDKPVQDSDLATKTSEYEALAKPLLLWLKDATAQCLNKNLPNTLVEIKVVLSDFQKFRLEDIPAKLANKRRLEILFHEIEQTKKENMIGQFPLEEQIHIDNLTKQWDRLVSAVDDRDHGISDEIARLQRLQKLAEKVHKDSKSCEGYLDDVEQRLNEELSRYDSIHPLDAKENCDALQKIFSKIDSYIQNQLTDVQNLRDGKYHQADSMYKRVFAIHERLEGLTNKLQTELLPKIRAVGPVDLRQTSATSPNNYSPFIRNSTSSMSASPSSGSISSQMLIKQVSVSPLTASPQPSGSHDESDSMATRGQKSVMAGVSPAELLRICIEWVENKRKSFDPASLEFSSVGKLEKTLTRLKEEHTDIINFKRQLETCHDARNTLPKEELASYTQWLTKIEGAYSSIMSISSEQLDQCESLLEFINDASSEIRWLNEKEEEELTRNWNATTMSAEVMREHFQVYTWKKKRLMDDLQSHEKLFSDIQDRGEAIVKKKSIGSSMCGSYLNAMQERWGWLLKIASCIDLQLGYVETNNQFYNEVEECAKWLNDQANVLNTEFSRTNISLDESEQLIRRMQEMRNTLAHYEQIIKSLQQRLPQLMPLKMREQLQKHPLPVQAVCSFSQDDFVMEKGENCILLDNSNPLRWRVRNSKAAAGLVPSICLSFPPPDVDCKRAVAKLEEQFQQFIALWKEKQSKLKEDTLFATMQIVKHWDVAKFKSLGAAQREAILKAINSDAQRLLTESNLPELKQVKLKETLQKCNDNFVKLNKKLREKESKEPKSTEEKAEEMITNIAYSLQTVESSLNIYMKEPVCRDQETFCRCENQHKETEEQISMMADELTSLRRITPGLGPAFHSRTTPLQAKLDTFSNVSSLYKRRLQLMQAVMDGTIQCSEEMNSASKKLENLQTVVTDVDMLQQTSDELQLLKEDLGTSKPVLLQLGENCRSLRNNIESGRTDVIAHPDMDKLDRDVAEILNKWRQILDETDQRQKKLEKSREILALYGSSSSYSAKDVASNGHSEAVTRQRMVSMQERSSTLHRLSKSGQSSRAIRNKLEELYDELSSDLRMELEWGRGVEKALVDQHGIPSSEEELRQQRDEHQQLVEDLQAHLQLARTIVYQNEQLRDHEIAVLTSEEIYEQDVQHKELLSRLDSLFKEVDQRIKYLSNCLDENIKFNAEKAKLENWLDDAVYTLTEMHKRTNQLSRLRDVTDRYKAFQSEVIAHQADMRFLDLTAQKFITEANNYRRKLMLFKAETNGTRSSLILDDEPYPVEEDVSRIGVRFKELLADCDIQVASLNNVSDTQRLFNDACDKLEAWLQMAEKNLGAIKREPIKPDHSGVQEQLDRVRDFTNAVMAQEKLIDDLKVQGNAYSEALARTKVDGRHIEDIHETVNDLSCRHGLVAAEATARANILNTAMVQSQGLTASIDSLLGWIVSADTALQSMKPLSLNMENLEDQINEFKMFEADVESNRHSVAQVNSHATDVISTCTPKLAAAIDMKLQELNTKSQAIITKCRERSRDIKEIYADLQEFNSKSAELSQWLTIHMQTLRASTDTPQKTQQLKDKVSAIHSQTELKRNAYEAALNLGRNLKENPKTGQVSSVKDTMSNLSVRWSEFEQALNDSQEQISLKEEQLGFFKELSVQVSSWLSSMERRIDALEPVSLDVQMIEDQIESIQPLLSEYEEHEAKLCSLNDIGNKCDSLASPFSPTQKLNSSNRFRLPPLHASDFTNGFGNQSSKDSQNNIFIPDDLSDVQRDLVETNHRYDVIGERLTDRQSDLQKTLAGLKLYLIDVQQLMVYLNEVESEVFVQYNPRDAADAKKKLADFRKFNENFLDKSKLLESIRQRVYELTVNKDSVPGMFDTEAQLAQLEDRWKAVHQASLSRCMALEGIESNLASFTDSANFLASWLQQKEKMLIALGPIATEPNIIKSQLHQVQVLDDELRSQQTKYDHCLECGIQILDKMPSDSEQSDDINKRLDNMAKQWNNLENQIKVRRQSLKAVMDNSSDLYDTLGYISEWLTGAADKISLCQEHNLDSSTESNMIKKLKADVEKNEKMVKYAQELSRKLIETLNQPVAEAEIKQKMMAVSRPFNEIKKKLDVIESTNKSRADQEESIHGVCDDMLAWMKSVSRTLKTPVSLSAIDEVLKEQMRNHERFENELSDRYSIMKQLDNQVEKLEAAAKNIPPEMSAKIDVVLQEWQNIQSDAEKRDKIIKATTSQSDQFANDISKMLTWLDMADGKLAAVSKPRSEKKDVESSLKDVQVLQSEIARKKLELAAMASNVQELLGNVDTDKEVISDRFAKVQSRWKSLEKSADQACKSLEEKAIRITEQHDMLNDISRQVKECEDILVTQNALGAAAAAAAYDNKNVDQVKSAQNQLKQLRPKLEALHAVNGEFASNGAEDEIKPKIVKESEMLLSRFDALDANIDTWIHQMELATKKVKEFQATLKSNTVQLSDLDDSLDNFDAIGRDSGTIRRQLEEVKALEAELATKEDAMAQLETQCRKLTHSGYIQEPQVYKSQIESMKKQIAKLQGKASQRHNNIINKLDEVENFENHMQTLQREIAKASASLKSMKPVASDVQVIKKQQQEFKDFTRSTADPLMNQLEQANKLGHILIRSAGSGVATSNIENDLEMINQKWAKLSEQVKERESKLDTGLLQTGKYKESVLSLQTWLKETEEMVSKQKSPSSEYKVAKAQLQEQKFLQKMVNDRMDNVETIQQIATQIQDQLDGKEQQIMNAEVNDILTRWNSLKTKVDERSKALDENLEITRAFHDTLEPFLVWLDKAEKKLMLASPIVSDFEALQKQRSDHLQFNIDIGGKALDVGAILKRGQDLIKRCHGEEASLVKEKLAAIEKRFSDLEAQSKSRLDKIDTAIPIARNFQDSCGKLLEWLDRVQPAVDSVKPEKSEIPALEKQLADIEPVFESVVSQGTLLSRLVPGDGAENIAEVLNKTQKQFSHISDQIRKKVEKQKAAQEMKVELESSIDDLAQWFADVEAKLASNNSCSSDPVELRQRLQSSKMLNDEVITQRGRLKQLLNTTKKLQREGVINESPSLNNKIEAVNAQAESLANKSSQQLGLVEQVVPLASQFQDLHVDIVGWLAEAEAEMSQKAVTPEQIRSRQQVTKALAQDVSDHKPFIDKLAKIGPQLAKLCSGTEAVLIQNRLDEVLESYNRLKTSVQTQSVQLKEKDEHAQKFTDTVEDIISDLQTTQEAVIMAAPIAAQPNRLREQLDANQAIIESMDRKLDELNMVKADADRMIAEAGGVEDDSVKALKAKISNLTKLYNDIKQATENRNKALEQTLNVSEDFWSGLDGVKEQLMDVQGTLITQSKPSLDPELIKQQQQELESLQKRIHEMTGGMNAVSQKGDKLSKLVGETEQPIVVSSVSGVNSEYNSLKESWKQRYDQLLAALHETNLFQAELVKILNWLQVKEEKMSSLGSIPGDTKSVKNQIEMLKEFTNDVNDKYLEVESLNQQATDMVKERPETEAKVIKQPMAEVNKRWKSLLDGIGQRKTKLQNALLSLGQFQAAVVELGQWLDRTEMILAEEEQPNVCGDPKIIEIELAKHKILLNDVQSHQNAIDQVNQAGQQVISSEGGAEASATRLTLNKLNQRWEAVLSKTKNWQLSLEDALREAVEYQSSLNDMVQRLSEIDGQLSTSKPVGGLPETAKEQLQEFMETYNELEQAQPKVAQLIQSGEELLEKGNDVSAQALQQNLENLKSRWDLVTTRATEKKARLEQALQQAEKFHEDQQSFINWLVVTEKALDKLAAPGCTLDSMQIQIAAHKDLSQDITAHREKMLALDKISTHLRYFSQKADSTLIKNTSISVQHRWEKIISRIAERGRQLDQALKEAKTFNDSWTDICQWLDNSDQLLDDGQMNNNNDPEKIKLQISKHKEFQRALISKQPTYETLMRQGKDLLVKSSDENDTQSIGAMLTSLKSKWSNVTGKSVERQRRLEESLLFSGQFKDALQALLGWLYKIEPFISDEQNVHGDLETVTKLAEQQKVFQQELAKRASNMAQVRDTAKQLIDKSPDNMPELQSQLIELTTSWDRVTKQAERRQLRIEDAIKMADDFSLKANAFLEWVSDCEPVMKLDPDILDDEASLQASLDNHKAYVDVIDKQRKFLAETLAIGDEILSKSHQEAVPIMKRWLAVLKQRMDDVGLWVSGFEKTIQDNLDAIRNQTDMVEELLGWLTSSENALAAMEEDPLPPEASIIEDMLSEHQDFETEISSRQVDIERLIKPKRKGDRSGAVTPTGRRSSTGTPSGRKSKMEIRKTSQTPEPAFKNPRVQTLSIKWRQVWLMTMDRRRRLQDALDQQKERQRLKNFNFDEWRKRYMDWMNHNKARVMDFFRRIDKDKDGKITRDDFISGINASKFPTSDLELNAVANLFDKEGNGYIDYKEFMNSLRTDIEKEQEKKTEAERIHEEVQRQVSRCCCTKQFAIQKVSDNKYVFGESQKLRLVRILRSTVMVRVGGGWQALDEFLVKNDPCRAKGRTNTELREKFILSENVVGQGMSGFVSKGPSGSRLSGGTRSGSTTPVTPYGHHHHHHQHSTTPVAGMRGTTPDREVSAIMSRKPRESPSYGLSPSAGGANSLPSSRASSRCSDISEDPESYEDTRVTGSRPTSTTTNVRSRIPSLINRSKHSPNS